MQIIKANEIILIIRHPRVMMERGQMKVILVASTS
jgi:hypothetical protein